MRTAVVTGGASGIGQAIARRLAADGYRVAVLDLNPVTEAGGAVGTEVATEVEAAAGTGVAVSQKADVTDRAQVDAALAAVRDELGPVTVLVNAAGLDGFKRFTDLSFDTWRRVLDVNLNGTFHCIQATLPDMVGAGWGRIVNISSSSAHSGQPYMAHYVAAKSAVNGLTKALALEFGPQGITVNAVPPGFIDTPMLRRAESRQLLGSIGTHIENTPVRRIGRPEDIAAACAFLVSEEAGYVTGQILGVNGGRNT